MQKKLAESQAFVPIKTWIWSGMAVLCGLLVLLSGSPVTAKDSYTLKRSITHTPQRLDPQLYTSVTQRVILNDIFAGLVTIDRENQIVPAVAENWQISTDGKSYHFFLRKDAFWQDGTPVTAQDFVLAFERLQRFGRRAFQLPLYRDIAGLETGGKALGVVALDNYTLEFTLSQPFDHFIRVLSRPAAFPVPRHQYEALGDDWALPENIFGNGAYRLGDYVRGKELVLSKSETYYGVQDVQIPEVRYIRLKDRNMTLRTTLSEGLDVSATLEQRQLNTARKLQDYTLYSRNQPNLVFLYFNPSAIGLQNPVVRQALYLTTNSGAIIEANGYDFETVDSFMPPLASYNSKVRKPNPDMKVIHRAQQLMASAGYSADNRLKLSLVTDTQVTNNFAVSLRRQYEAIFVELTLEHRSTRENAYDLAILNWTIGYPDPEYFLRLFVSWYNHHAPVDRMLDMESMFKEARSNPDSFKNILGEVEMRLVEQYLAVPLYSGREHRIVSRRVKNWSAVTGTDNQSRWLRLE